MPLASFVHLIGSLPVDTVEDAIQTVSSNLLGRLRRIPDGEPGERSTFVLWQIRKVWPKEVICPMSINDNQTPGLGASKIDLTKDHLPQTTGYAEAAISSYQVFRRLKDSGAIPEATRFQVCLPSPMTVVGLELHPEYQLVGERLYRDLLHKDLQAIQDAIPHHDLAIQFDILAEVCFMEHAYGQKEGREPVEWFFNQLRPYFHPVREGIASRMASLALPVHRDVELGLHLCYGDAQRRHIIEPVDTNILAELIDICLENISHKVDWIQLPVPKDRIDAAYLEPLSTLQTNSLHVDFAKTNLILGLVHANDAQGTGERIAAARKALPGIDFGISTECGMGRLPREDLSGVFQIFKDHSEPSN